VHRAHVRSTLGAYPDPSAASSCSLRTGTACGPAASASRCSPHAPIEAPRRPNVHPVHIWPWQSAGLSRGGLPPRAAVAVGRAELPRSAAPRPSSALSRGGLPPWRAELPRSAAPSCGGRPRRAAAVCRAELRGPPPSCARPPPDVEPERPPTSCGGSPGRSCSCPDPASARSRSCPACRTGSPRGRTCAGRRTGSPSIRRSCSTRPAPGSAR
jgi:hypothetical protein